MPTQKYLDKLYETGSEYVLIKSEFDLLIEKNFRKGSLNNVKPNYNHWVYKEAKEHKLNGLYFEIGPGLKNPRRTRYRPNPIAK